MHIVYRMVMVTVLVVNALIFVSDAVGASQQILSGDILDKIEVLASDVSRQVGPVLEWFREATGVVVFSF